MADSPDLYHRSVDVREAGQARFTLRVAHKPGGPEWVGYQARPFGGSSPGWLKFVNRAGVRQLAVLGSPGRATATGPSRPRRAWALVTLAST
ncbi:MAG: hypothetical protein ACRDY1_11500 [Acidimicrobiales bacterium]